MAGRGTEEWRAYRREQPGFAGWLRQSLALAGACASLCFPSQAADHWAFIPPADVAPPPATQAEWPETPIDAFILAKLAEHHLEPAPPAGPRALIRRLSFDLTGLPPAPDEVEAFVGSFSRDAAEAVHLLVERLLGSPHYGERWGRWWLDVARYADTNGQDENKVMANAWRYRDWVVRAFNANLPFDQFIMAQLAGDLMPLSSDEAENLDRLIATGFLVLGPKMLAEQDKPKLVMDIIDEQIDTIGRAFLGLTLGCARCHDHKFDPVPARDYYAMAGIFKSTRTMADLAFVSKFNERTVATQPELAAIEAHAHRLAGYTNRANAFVKALFGIQIPALDVSEIHDALSAFQEEHRSLQSSAPPPAAQALAVAEGETADLPVHLRGSHLTLAPEAVPRGLIQAVAGRRGQTAIPAGRSGRRELAEWLVSPDHPLTARVIVNRVWQGHFGEGLVRTPDNFGLRGEAPSHPALLDWLAVQFVQSGWDLKALHRLIVRSAVYQQSALASEAPSGDPANRLLSRFPRQRLEAEMIRDSLLAVAGRLDRSMGGSLVAWKNNEYAPADQVSAQAVRRTLYLPVVRDRVFDALTLFDFASPSVCSAKRSATVVSHQALFFLNSAVVKESALAVAQGVLAGDPDEASRIRKAYLRILNRPATAAETARARRFLAELPSGSSVRGQERALEDLAALCQVLMASNEFIYRF